MAPEKSPAYQWYPKDWDTDESVKLMTYEQEGIYRRLLDHQALHGSIPAEPRQIAMLVPKVSPVRFLKLWVVLSAKFPIKDGRRANQKLERVRERSEAYRKKQSENGQRGAERKWGAKAN